MTFFLIIIITLIFNISLGAVEISSEQHVVPSSIIKEIYINTRCMMENMQFYNQKLIINYPAHIDTLYFLSGKDTRIKKILDDILEKKTKNSVEIPEFSTIVFTGKGTAICSQHLNFGYQSMKSSSFVTHLGAFLSSAAGDTLKKRSIWLKNNIVLSEIFGFVEISAALKVIEHINAEIENPSDSDNNCNYDSVFHKLSNSWKRIAQLDVAFAKRTDPTIFEKTLAQPKYANTLISKKLTNTDRNRMVELDLLIKAMKTLREDAYEYLFL
jgi:hypothetical protein